jgi:putative hemolysin
MPPLDHLALAIFACLIAAVSFAGHVAYTSLAGGKLAGLATLDDDRAATFGALVKHGRAVIARWLIVRVVCSVVAGYIFSGAGSVGYVRVLWAVLVPTLVYGTFAELFGSVAGKRPEATLIAVHKVFRLFDWVAIPIAAPLQWFGLWVSDRIPEAGPMDVKVTETQVEFALRAGTKSGALEAESAEMIRNVLEFRDLTIGEVMIPRAKVACVEMDTPLTKVLEMVSNDGHSRYPVYRDTIDNVVGLLYVKDLFDCLRASAIQERTLADLIRKEVIVTVESQSALSLLREMRARRQHLAIVTDEFGGTEGLVTLEDILEEIVGEIRDEYDTEAPLQKLGEGRFLVDASMALSDLEAQLGTSLVNPKEYDENSFESLGGLLLHTEGHVPQAGAVIKLSGMRFIVREADERRVMKVEVQREAQREGHGRASIPSIP